MFYVPMVVILVAGLIILFVSFFDSVVVIVVTIIDVDVIFVHIVCNTVYDIIHPSLNNCLYARSFIIQDSSDPDCES